MSVPAAAVSEDSSSGTGTGTGTGSGGGGDGGGAICFTITKQLSVLPEKLKAFMLKYIVSSNQAPPPPLLPISSPVTSHQQQQRDITDLHPVTKIVREQELGRAVITIAVPLAAAVLTSGNDGKSLVVHVVVVGLMMGIMAIWNGILFRDNFPRLANALEQVGISLVVLSLYGLVAAFLPKEFSWSLWLSAALCLIPFIHAFIGRYWFD